MLLKKLNYSAYEIKQAHILKTKTLTSTERLFEVSLPGNEPLNHDPGQFVEVSLFNIGEAPISVCSSPTQRESFDLCIRMAGRLTAAVHNLSVGDTIGIRGPFGKGFPITEILGKDILLIAGGLGIAPLRSLIQHIIANRRSFGKTNILLGCKDPDSMLFGRETEIWNKRLDLNFCCTVDQADPEWKGNVGLITNLIPGVNIDPYNTFAVVCGPPVMYKYVLKELLQKHIPEQQIYLSLERHMKCGLGKCGHCQIENIYCCRDGPVFNYNTIKNMKGAL